MVEVVIKRLVSDNTWAAKAGRTVLSVLPVARTRKGSCKRCGACCHLPVRCGFLVSDDDGKCSCSIWRFRPLNCRKYPRSDSELLTRDTCGYSFGDSERE